jgi:Tol biopolymer transport system component
MTASKAEPRTVSRWPAAIVLLTLGVVAGLLSIDCTNRPAATGSTTTSLPTTPEPSLIPTPTTAVTAQAPQQCIPSATQASHPFASVRGFITYTDGSEIWAVDPQQPAKRISLGSSHGQAPVAWSRDGSRLLLVVERRNAVTGGMDQDLCVMNADGSQTRLTSDGQSGEGSVSPDGTTVVFSRWNDGLYVVNAEGGTPRLIAKSYMAWWLESPAWSPDGSRIAYMVYLEGGPEGLTYQIWTVNPDGTDPRPLVDLGECGGGGCSGGLAWSPDGSMLAFHSMRDFLSTRTRAIYVVHADGSGLHRINDHGSFPFWSPDGSRIAFVWLQSEMNSSSDTSNNGHLFTMAPDGSDVRPVEGVVVVPSYERASSWNPVVRT